MRILCTAAALLALSATAAEAQAPANAQPRSRPNAVYVEAFGNGFLLSANYERTLVPNVGVRVGAGSFPSIDPAEAPDRYQFPLMMHLRTGKGRLQPELGVGVLVEYLDTSAIERVHDIEPVEVNPALSLGGRLTPPDTPLLLRAGITPLFFDGKVHPWLGVSAGITF